MSSLQILKQILPLDEDEIPKEIVSPLQELDLSNLKQYIQHSQQPGNSLEQIRSDSDPSFLADDEQLSFLISSFEEYKLEIRSHRSKLKPIQSIISNFNTDLSSLSSSLIVSREKSAKLSQNLKAQKTLTEKLNPIIIDLIVPPEIIKSVIKSPVNESWLENLSFINEKLQLIEQINESKDGSGAGSVYFGSVAFNELEKSIHSITSKAVERIRDYIISKIKLLRSNSSQTSSQLIQRELLSVKEIFLFLMQHHPELGKQLRLAYTYTMKWYYETRFAKYIYALEKLKLRHVDQSLLLGSTTSAEVTSTFGGLGFGWFSLSELLQLQLQQQQQNQLPSVPGSAASHKIIMSEYLPSIDKRIQLLHPIVEEEESPEEAIPSQIAETSPFAYWLEFVYKQWSVALMDNTIVEYLFMVEFFYLGDEKFDEIDEQSIMNDKNSNAAAANGTKLKNWSQIMFTNVFKMGYEFVQWLITHQPLAFLPKNSNANSRIISSATIAANVASTGSSSTFGTCDGYAILLMIRMIQISQSSLHNEFHIPIADEYLNSLLLLLWPHFTKVIDLNCESIKKSVLSSSSSKFGSSSNLAPVGVTQQFAQYLLGLLKLAEMNDKKDDKEIFQGEPLFTSVRRIRNDFEGVLTKLSGTMFSKSKKIEKEIFLYNNYFLVVSILKNEREDNELFNEQINHFEMLCEAYKK